MSEYLKGKVAVVTGSANGIGRASALRLAQEGADVAVLDLEDGPLQEVAEAIRALGRRVYAQAADLRDRAQCRAAYEQLTRTLGPVDVMVNNVGMPARGKISEFWCSEPETWDGVIDVTLKVTMMWSRLVVPGMRERKWGKIVNIASDAALMGEANMVDYSGAKGGVIGFTRALARELGPYKVTVNAVCPGLTRTRGPMTRKPEEIKAWLEGVPMQEMCEPADIANGVAFLSSDQSRMMTGQLLVINGGRHFH